MPLLYANMSKNATIPRVAGGAFWADDLNGWAYLYGGEYTDGQPQKTTLYAYDVWHDLWHAKEIASRDSIQGVAYGASVSVPERGQA